MYTDIKLILTQDEIAAVVAKYVMARLNSTLPRPISAVQNMEDDLINEISCQILTDINLHIVNGEIHS